MGSRGPYATRRRIPLDGLAYHSMRWLKEQMLERGFPLKFADRNGKTLRMGPLTVHGVPQMQMHVVRATHAERLTAPEGQASVLVIAARDKHDRLKSAQVVMNLESLVQIMSWLAEADPDNFLRPLTNKGMKYDNDATHRTRSRNEQAGLGRKGLGTPNS